MSRIGSRVLACLTAIALLAPVQALVASPASAAAPTPGNIIVSRLGDGSSSLTSAATPVFLDEYKPDGTFVQTTALPTAAAGTQRRLTMSGSATSEGALSLSADGRYVTVAGYDAAVGTASVASTTGSAANRVVGRLGADGSLDTSTATASMSFGGNNARGATTDDGSRFWIVGANGIQYLSSLGASSSTTISTANFRVPLIAGGQLYASSGSTSTLGLNAVGSGLPTSSASTSVLPNTGTTSPYGALFLDRDGTPGPDTLYLADDTSSIGLTKFALVGGNWTKEGTYAGSGGLRGVTGSVTNGNVVLWTVTSGGALLQLTDTAGYATPPNISAGTSISAGTNEIFRGVAFAPQAPTPTPTPSPSITPTPAPSPSSTPMPSPTPSTNTAPTITPSSTDRLPLTVDDPFNPPATRSVTVADAETDVGSLTTSVTSSNPAFATATTTGTGSVRGVSITPVGVGYATLTVTVSDGDLTASTDLPVAVSAALPAGTLNLYGASDASTAVDLGNNLMAVGDDENNTLRVYDRTRSGYPVASLDLRAAGLALRDGDPTREIDIEAAATKGGTTFWLGSHGQNKDNKTRLNRQELFTTTASGSTLTVGGSYQHLRDDMIAWDNANGAPLGLAAAANRAPEGDGTGGPTGFNIEGAEFSPDGNTLYVGFRGPLTADGKAIVIPVTNPDALVTANPTTSASAAFGTAMSWDLGGRGIREIRRSSSGAYVLIAGPTGETGPPFAPYSWDGNPAHQPVPLSADLTSFTAHGKPEGIVDVPNPLTGTSQLQLITDSGDEVWYGDGQAAKDLDPVIRKATSARIVAGTPPVCSGFPVTIGSVQGTGDISPVAGSTVTVRGTVVGDDEGPSPALRGIYVQDSGDGDPATSDGIFIFEGNTDRGLHDGDVVQVTGTVSEFQGQTQITPGAVDSCGRTATIPPTDVTLPVSDPTVLERYESMLVRFHQTLTVTENFQLGRFGQVELSGNGKLSQPTAIFRSGPQAQALQAANDLDHVIVDDPSQAQNPDPILFARGGQPLSASNTLRNGDTTTDPVGVLTYTWAGNAASGNAYRLRPLEALGGRILFDPSNPRPTDPPSVGSAGVRVASANLLNFFNTYTGCHLGTLGATTDCRGAENDTEYQRQLAKEVASLRFLNADVVGIMEMENDGYGPSSAIQALVDGLNAQDGPGTWAFVNPDAATGVTDVAGSDAIKAGLLYKTAAVQPVAGDTFVDQTDLFERRPVAQTFQTSTGTRFTVVANHFKSKGSCPTSGPDADQGDGQSCWNAHRTEQATELARWLRDIVIPAVNDPDILIVGDLNSYAGEDPIATLESAGYTNLNKSYGGPDAYSYVFDGQWGYLDYALASDSMVAQVTGAGEAHHNADEPSVLDYNTDFKSGGQITSLYAPDRFRTSDHDPILVGLNAMSPPAPTPVPTDTPVVSPTPTPVPPTPTPTPVVTPTPTPAPTATPTPTPAPGKVTTTTTLSASGLNVLGLVFIGSINAHVTPNTAAGTVQFWDNGRALGAPVRVTNGNASTGSLHLLLLDRYTATFTPDNPAAFTSSTSNALVFP